MSAQASGYDIVLDPNKIQATANSIGIPLTATVLIGHELGHVATNILSMNGGNWNISKTNPTDCDERCAVQFENKIRAEEGLPLRIVPARAP